MENIYYRIPTAAELQGTSYRISDFVDNEPHVEVWDENWDSILLYRKFSTQWRMSASGPAALDMTVFFHELDRKGVDELTYDITLSQLLVIENEALKWIHRR